jgi:hypothetical protein
VPEVSIHEHSEPSLSENEVGRAEDPYVISTETKAESLEGDGQPFLRFGLRSPHRLHDAAPRFLVEHVRHVLAASLLNRIIISQPTDERGRCQIHAYSILAKAIAMGAC